MATLTSPRSLPGSPSITRRSPRLAKGTKTSSTLPVSLSSGVALPREGWKRRGSCRNVDMELFFGPDNAPMPKEQVERAREVCRQCPVWQDCLVSSAENDESYGVWAALTPDERRRALSLTHGDILMVMGLWQDGELFRLVVLR